MRPAAVGFHCPEESDRGRDARRHDPRTLLGGRQSVERPALVTQILIGLCVVAYFLQGFPGLTGGGRVNDFTRDFGLVGAGIALNDEYYRLVTAAFLHGSVIHILFNMYALFLLGFQLEAILGRARYIGLFLACAIGGNALSYLVNGLDVFSVGASTAIFGFFAAYYVIARRLRADTTQILVIMGINLVITFTIPQIDRWGHIGGMVVGALIGLLYAYVPARRGALQAVGVVAVIGLLLLAAVLKTNAIEVPSFARLG